MALGTNPCGVGSTCETNKKLVTIHILGCGLKNFSVPQRNASESEEVMTINTATGTCV